MNLWVNHLKDFSQYALDERANVMQRLKKVKGLNDKALQMMSQLPMPVLTSIVNQLSPIVAQKESTELEEAPVNTQSIIGLKMMADRMVRKLSKEGLNRRVQMMTQIGKILGLKVKTLPNGKIQIS